MSFSDIGQNRSQSRERNASTRPQNSPVLLRDMVRLHMTKIPAANKIANTNAVSAVPINSARMFPFPDWYLPKGTINASSDELESASSSCERWAIGFAGVVIFAVAAEVIIALAKVSYIAFLADSVFADAAIAIGVVGEVFFGTIRNNNIQTELRNRSNMKLAEAIERAAKAEWETERLRSQLAWRRVSPEQEMLLRGSLSTLKDATVIIWHFIHDPESEDFSEDFAAIFRLSGWSVFVQPASFQGNFAFGIRVPAASGDDERASSAVASAFTEAGIDFESLNRPGIQMTTGGRGDQSAHPRAELYIGPRQKPE